MVIKSGLRCVAMVGPIEPRRDCETELREFNPTMIVAALLVAALSVEPQVFPAPLCENLPEVRPEVKTWVAHVAPELAQVQVRELPEKTVLDVFGRPAVAGWGSIDVLTNSVFREPCTFYFLTRGASRRGRSLRAGPHDRHSRTG